MKNLQNLKSSCGKAIMITSISLLLTSNVFPQNYYPLLDSNIFWNGGKSDLCAPYSKIISFFIDGDTLINSNYYYKVYKKDSIILGSPAIDTLEYSAAIREDTVNKKVFLIPANDSVEKLIYDFSLIVNDTVNVFNISGNWTKIVESIDYIEINSTCRKRLKVYSDFCEEEYWIEGIGSTKGLLFAGVCGGSCVDYSLNSIVIKNDTIYNNSDAIVSCSINNTSENLNYKKSKILIYPNPSDDILNISFINFELNRVLIKISDLLGKIIYEYELNYPTYHLLNISELKSGIYFYKISSENNIIDTGKIIVN